MMFAVFKRNLDVSSVAMLVIFKPPEYKQIYHLQNTKNNTEVITVTLKVKPFLQFILLLYIT
jgi:hypothetical protein